mgnify:CR=1 FL=1
MKRILVAAFFLAGFGFAFSQEKQEEDKDLKTWYHKDFSTTKVYGVNTENAYKFFESKGLKPKSVVVGVIDSGVEVDHPGLVKNLWKNVNEVPDNGKDDDGNGYVDDVYGWNFIGGKNGDVGVDNTEVARVVRQYKPFFEGDNAVQNKENQTKMSSEFDMYLKAKEIFTKKSTEAQQQFQFYSGFQKEIPGIVATLNGKTLTKENLASIKPTTQVEYRNLAILSNVAQDPAVQGKTPAEVQTFLEKKIKEALDKGYEKKDIVKIVFSGLSERKALEIESKLILFFGSIYERKKGASLYNLDIPSRPKFNGLMAKFPSKGSMVSEGFSCN